MLCDDEALSHRLSCRACPMQAVVSDRLCQNAVACFVSLRCEHHASQDERMALLRSQREVRIGTHICEGLRHHVTMCMDRAARQAGAVTCDVYVDMNADT